MRGRSLAATLAIAFGVTTLTVFVLVGSYLYLALERQIKTQDNLDIVLAARHARRLAQELDAAKGRAEVPGAMLQVEADPVRLGLFGCARRDIAGRIGLGVCATNVDAKVLKVESSTAAYPAKPREEKHSSHDDEENRHASTCKHLSRAYILS